MLRNVLLEYLRQKTYPIGCAHHMIFLALPAEVIKVELQCSACPLERSLTSHTSKTIGGAIHWFGLLVWWGINISIFHTHTTCLYIAWRLAISGFYTEITIMTTD